MKNLNRRSYFRITIFSFAILAAIISILLPFNFYETSQYDLNIGSVSAQDILAPYSLAYSSTILTEKAKEDARLNTLPVYLPADPEIEKRQMDKAQKFLDLIQSLRLETHLTDQQKLDEVYHSDLRPIPSNFIKQLLIIKQSDFNLISNEVIRLLKQAYKNPIRSVDLQSTKSSIYGKIDPEFSSAQTNLVYGITTPFIISNSMYSEEKTNEQKQSNANQVKPIIKSFLQGEIIVERGQIINAEIYESLQIFRLIRVHRLDLKDLLSAIGLSIVIFGVIWAYLFYRNTKLFDQLRNLSTILFLFICFLIISRLVIPGRTIIPYVLPIPAFALVIASLIHAEIAIIFSFSLAIMVVFGLDNAMFLFVYYSVTSLIGILFLGRGSKISQFFLSGLLISLSGIVIITAFYIPQAHSDLVGFITLCGAALFYGFASAGLTLITQYIASRFLGIPTALQLIEISRPDHPLLQYILRNAPGTYQHSLQVANLAEQIAEQIGADPILTRVGALYHDAGKSLNPFFFIENQIPGKKNPHDSLDPHSSSKIIIRHVHDGVILAKKYQLPMRIQDFILEHHGTSITRYQYGSALSKSKKDTNLNPDDFRYPGPSPRSKETAVLMIADGCEAKARASLPKSREEIRKLVVNIVDQFRESGQFNNTNLTMTDFSKIIDGITNTLINTYHPRLNYPEIQGNSKKP